MNQGYRTLLFRIIVSASLLLFIFWKVQVTSLLSVMRGLDWLVFPAFAFNVIGSVISALRWKSLITGNEEIGFLKLLYLYMLGRFASTFLPTSIGGDIVRIYSLAQHTKDTSSSFSTVFMDRATGFFALVAIATIGLFATDLRFEQRIYYFDIMLLVICFLLLCMLFSSLARRVLFFIINAVRIQRLRKILENSLEATLKYRNHKWPLFKAIIWSFTFQIAVVFQSIIIGKMLGINIPILYYFVFVPLINALTMVPVSINGLGIREGGFVLFFSKVGVAPADAAAMSLIIFGLSLLLNLFGGALLAIRNLKKE